MVQNQIELQKTNVNAINTFLKLDDLRNDINILYLVQCATYLSVLNLKVLLLK